MAREYETRVLEIDVDYIKDKLKSINAKKVSESLMRRWVFDMDPGHYEWIRLRDDGRKVTITYKKKTSSAISDTEELEVEVDSFKNAAAILNKLPFKAKLYQENKRILFILDDIEFTIDTWPDIPTFLEIESSSEELVKKGLSLLNLEGKDIGNVAIKDVYTKYGIDLHSIKELKFKKRN